jgi:hypothetical protein
LSRRPFFKRLNERLFSWTVWNFSWSFSSPAAAQSSSPGATLRAAAMSIAAAAHDSFCSWRFYVSTILNWLKTKLLSLCFLFQNEVCLCGHETFYRPITTTRSGFPESDIVICDSSWPVKEFVRKSKKDCVGSVKVLETEPFKNRVIFPPYIFVLSNRKPFGYIQTCCNPSINSLADLLSGFTKLLSCLSSTQSKCTTSILYVSCQESSGQVRYNCEPFVPQNRTKPEYGSITLKFTLVGTYVFRSRSKERVAEALSIGLLALLQQFVAPDFQLCRDMLNACGLFNGFGFDLTGVMYAQG